MLVTDSSSGTEVAHSAHTQHYNNYNVAFTMIMMTCYYFCYECHIKLFLFCLLIT